MSDKAWRVWGDAEKAALRELFDQGKSIPQILDAMRARFPDRPYSLGSLASRLHRAGMVRYRRGEDPGAVPPSPGPSPAPPPAEPRNPGSDQDLEALVDSLQEMTARRPMTIEALADALDQPPRRAREVIEWGRARGKRVEVLVPEDPLRVAERHHALKDQVLQLTAARRHLERELRDRNAQLGVMQELRQQPPLPITPPTTPRRQGDRRRGVPVFLFSDWHVEEPVQPEKVNGLNEYDLRIADRCIDDLAEAVEWFSLDPRWAMRELVLAFLGDLFSGYIHEELQEQNFLSPVQAVVWLLERVERLLRRVLQKTKFEKIVVVMKDGNHGRLTNRIRVSTRTANSLEWLLYRTIAARFADEPRLQFVIEEGEYTVHEVYGLRIMYFHGDSVNYLGGVGGLLIPMRRGLANLRNQIGFDHACFGHFHLRVDHPEMSGNGSMIGVSPYSLNRKFEQDPHGRCQSFFLVDHERGKCLSAPVWLPRHGGIAPG